MKFIIIITIGTITLPLHTHLLTVNYKKITYVYYKYIICEKVTSVIFNFPDTNSETSLPITEKIYAEIHLDVTNFFTDNKRRYEQQFIKSNFENVIELDRIIENGDRFITLQTACPFSMSIFLVVVTKAVCASV